MHATLGDFLLDIVQNSWEAGAALVELDLEESASALAFTVSDNGRGMDKATLDRALDPFWTDGVKHPGRRVGLGLPFLVQTLESLGTRLDIESAPGRGTTVRGTFPLDHLDCPPRGDLVGTFVLMLFFEGSHDLRIRWSGARGSWEVSRHEVLDALGSLETVEDRELLRNYLESLEDDHGQDEP